MRTVRKVAVMIFLLVPTMSFALDWEAENKTILTNGLKTYEALQLIESEFGVEIDARGVAISRELEVDLSNVTLKKAVEAVLINSGIQNYTIRFDSNSQHVYVRVLRYSGLEAKNARKGVGSKSGNNPLVRDDLLRVDSLLAVDKNSKNDIKAFTFEEIENLTQNNVYLAQGGGENGNTFSQDEMEQIYKGTELLKKKSTDDGSLSESEIEQLRDGQKAQDSGGIISPEHLKDLSKD